MLFTAVFLFLCERSLWLQGVGKGWARGGFITSFHMHFYESKTFFASISEQGEAAHRELFLGFLCFWVSCVFGSLMFIKRLFFGFLCFWVSCVYQAFVKQKQTLTSCFKQKQTLTSLQAKTN